MESSKKKELMGKNGVLSNGVDFTEPTAGGEIQRLRCAVKNYDWGRVGSDSLVAGLHQANTGSRIDPEIPYAELWIGTHESGPCHVMILQNGTTENGGGSRNRSESGSGSTVSLKSWISDNPNVLGHRVLEKWGCNLPFLFKVLSVEKALSIQAHPDKALAEFLHMEHPLLYKDSNHKPEMALAITQFHALSGFISLQELKETFKSVPEITELVGELVADELFHIEEQDGDDKVKSVVRTIFTGLMSIDNLDFISKVISQMKNRLIVESKERELCEKERLVLQLEKQYPGDIGVIAAFFFNYVKLNAGEALYLDANEPHAYLSGDCVECMAASDNVVRAGLTSKHRDVQTLCSMLTYKRGYPEILKGFPLNPYIGRYLPPFDEFEIDSCILPPAASTVFPTIPGPSVFLVMEGKGNIVTGSSQISINRGDVLFGPAHTEIQITGENEIKLCRAGVSSRFLQTL